MRFIHTSDLQIGKAFGRAPDRARVLLQEARLTVIDNLADAARVQGANFVVVAGDVFDTAAPSDRELTNALRRMGRDTSVRWYLLPGNHDPARADGLWTRVQAIKPENVFLLLARSPLHVADDVWLLPAPLEHKRTIDDPTAWFDEADVPAGTRRVGVAHGSVIDFGGGRGTAENMIARDRAQRAKLDYLALGDWHNASTVDPRTHYSGTPEPDDHGRDITGQAWMVELGPTGEVPRNKAIQTASHAWSRLQWTLNSFDDFNREIAALASGSDLSRLVLKLHIDGIVSLAERAAIETKLRDDLAHQVHWLDLDMGRLVVQPTQDDLSTIDAQGVLRVAAERLKAMSEQGGSEAARAMAALNRLYLEQIRAPMESDE